METDTDFKHAGPNAFEAYVQAHILDADFDAEEACEYISAAGGVLGAVIAKSMTSPEGRRKLVSVIAIQIVAEFEKIEKEEAAKAAALGQKVLVDKDKNGEGNK